MGYTNCLLVSTMKKLDLFDNISYKYIKDIINEDDYDIEVEIERLDCDRVAWCKTQFTFIIPQLIDERFGEKYYKYKKFVVENEYNSSSAFALMMLELYEDDEEEEEEEEEDDWKYLCPNGHWGGQYGCDLCCDVPDIKNAEMEKEWLNKCNKYCYKLHKKWLNKKTDTEDSSTDEEEEEEEEKEEEVKVIIFKIGDVKYLKSADNTLYDFKTHEVIGVWNALTKAIDPEDEDEDEEEELVEF